jgi:hypothetical protein
MRISIGLVLLCFIPLPASAQEAPLLRDLEAVSPLQLTKAELDELLPSARMLRVIANGNTHIWTNDSDGTFIVSSDNRATNNRAATGRGKWHISDDGRYCIFIEWRASSEEWCRFVLRTSDGSYYTAKAMRPGTEKVYKFEIKK